VHPPLRLLDANLNRAREALRVMEDAARLGLDDAALAAALKEARHALRAVAERAGIDPLGLVAWRDTPGDVGTAHTAPAERDRRTLADVAIAAGKRAGEALRVIEETAKALPGPGPGGSGGASAAEEAKALRYRVYELERRLVLALGTGRGRQWRLCVLITEALCTHHPWAVVAERALEAGADCLQLREKSMDSGPLLARARRLAAMCRERGAALIVNDRPDVALLSGASGVHVGQTDLAVADVRRLAGASLLVGVSTADMGQALAAAYAGADYCGCGPMFPTSTKHKPVLSGPEYLRQYLADQRTARVPHLAISGITPAMVPELVRAGCRGVAVSSAVCSAPEPGEVCRALLEALGPAPGPG
jgi:thiamine-phosphate pyrophosphorylase